VNRSTTERGFVIYDEFTDTHGTGIRVQESSSAEESRCWIFADGTARGTSGAPHLNVEQAKRVRDALDAFISEHEEAAMTQLNATEQEVWRVWGLLSDDDPSPVKHIARALGMTPADVAFIVYPAEQFGRWEDGQEPDLPA
jgi:hypothetical protein